MGIARRVGSARNGAAQSGRRSGQARTLHVAPQIPERFQDRAAHTPRWTFATAYGVTFEAAKLKILPAGSFYTEPANVPHYIEIKEDAVLQVSGVGPSGRRFVNPPDSPQ